MNRGEIKQQEILDDLEKSGITKEQFKEYGLFEVTSHKELAGIGFQTAFHNQKIIGNHSVLAFPYYAEDGSIVDYRIKLYPSIRYEGKDGKTKTVKYLQRPNTEVLPYILPEVWKHKNKIKTPICITEGEKKAIALNRNGYPAIGISGVYNFQAKGMFNPALDEWEWSGRVVYIVFDSDHLQNPNIVNAEIELSLNLILRGANVKIVNIPSSSPTVKVGVDDFIHEQGLGVFETEYRRSQSFYDFFAKKDEYHDIVKRRLKKIVEKQNIEQAKVEELIKKLSRWIKWNASDKRNLFNKYSSEEKETTTLLQRATEIISSKITSYFKDEQSDVYAVIDNGEYYKLNSTDFKRIAHRAVIEELGHPISSQTIKDALTNIEAISSAEAEEKTLFIRVGENDGKLYYSLGDFKAVEISNGEWRIVNEPPIFRHFAHQRTQTEPSSDATIDDIYRIFDFMNIESESDKLLLLTYLITAFIPQMPHPILLLYGDGGAGKTSLQRLLVEIVDPTKETEQTLSYKSIDNLRNAAYQYWMLAYDNMSYIKQDLSDELCRCVTGGGVTQRKLYTDNEAVFYSYKNVVNLSGINLVATAPDLLDRAIIIRLNRILNNKEEKELNNQIQQAKPIILGSIFSILSNVWGKTESIPSPLPRMSDYAFYAYHIAELLGFGGEKFLSTYAENKKEGTLNIISEDTVATSIIKLLDEMVGDFLGTPEELYKKLSNYAELYGDFPKNAVWLSRRMNTLKTSLSDVGIYFDVEHDGERRIIHLWKQSKEEEDCDVGTV